jgi:kinesin family member 23
MKDITSGVDRYCLITHQPDTDGELETKLYKGDVIQTTSGGAQVVFDDVECLRQMNPGDSPPRKRKSQHDEQRTSRTPRKKESSQGIDIVESRCSVGIQGSKKQRL